MAENQSGRDATEIQKALQRLLKDHSSYYEGWRRSVIEKGNASPKTEAPATEKPKKKSFG